MSLDAVGDSAPSKQARWEAEEMRVEAGVGGLCEKPPDAP
jgi:hypothetical protein